MSEETLPGILVTIDAIGDVNFSANNEDISLPLAIAMMELAKQKMMAIFFQGVNQEKARAAATKPTLLVPTGKVTLRE